MNTSTARSLRAVLATALALGFLIASPLAASAASSADSPIVKALASPARPKADVDRDAARKPGELIAFAGIEPGDRVADIMPGKGYFTRIFSKLVGRRGQVYAIVPSELAQVDAGAPKEAHALARDPALSTNVVAVVSPSAELTVPEPLDVAWTSQNYHDLYGFFGAAQAARFDAAVFRALKPGGVFIVIDHVAAAGSSDTAPKTLHRIDPETVKAQVIAAGFVLEDESKLLANADDAHDLKVFDPAIRGRSDQFVFKFRKPMR
ncbi:class I SAM-dependent methyltransferase [soil metagenome]